MNAQIDFLKRCKELGLQGGKLSNWLDEIEALRAENEAMKQQVEQIEHETAEAIAAYFEQQPHAEHFGDNIAEAVRSGKWKEYK